MQRELRELILRYSRRGLHDWKETAKNGSVQDATKACLSNAIAETEQDIQGVLGGNPEKRKFIPMPGLSDSKDFDWCFFCPLVRSEKLQSLILFIVVSGTDNQCIAFRFEGPSSGTHGYTHLQLTHRLAKSGFGDFDDSVLPDWLPDSYPAFPIPANCPTDLFLSMMTAVHGHVGGADDLLDLIFKDTPHPARANQYMEMLDNMLCNLTGSIYAC